MKTIVVILGVPVQIEYEIHDRGYVEWSISEEGTLTTGTLAAHNELFTMLLRTHYSPFIEAACREAYFYDEQAVFHQHDDWADALGKYGDFNYFDKKLWKIDKKDEEDTPF